MLFGNSSGENSLLLFPFDRMFEFEDSEIQFYFCLRAGSLQVFAEQVRHDFAALLHQRLLLELVRVGRHLSDSTGQFAELGERFDNSNGRLRRPRAFQNSRQHVQPLFGKGFRGNGRILQSFEVVKIFHHILFFNLLQFDNVAFWKFLRVIFNRFVDFFRLHSVEFRHVGIQEHVLFAKPDNLIPDVAEFD